MDFYRIFAEWIKLWSASPCFKLICQTKSALVTTLRAQADLINELIDDRYEFVRIARLASYSRFSRKGNIFTWHAGC